MSSSSATRFLMLLTTTTSTPYSFRYPSLLRFTRHRRIPSSLSSFSNHYYHFLCPSHPRPLKLKSSPSHHLHQFHIHSHFSDSPSTTSTTSFPSPSGFSHPWPEYSNFIHSLTAAGYFNIKHGFDTPIDEIVSVGDFPEEFLRSCTASLSFARDNADALGSLSRRDIEVVVENGLPFLFKNSEESVRRMRLFLQSGDNNVLNSDRACTVDLVRFLLSYAGSLVSSEKTNPLNRELVESSVRSLFSELAQLAYYFVQSNLSRSPQNQFPDRYVQTPRPRGPIIEMKRGDWICPRCNFMNFARNVKCLECDEARPKRQLTGGEWECPQCDFYNYARNMACLRCDCKRPGEVSLGTTSSRSDQGYGKGSYVSKNDVDSRLAANEEKAQRWFSKVSQMNSTSDMNSAIADEDFPEIMPLRKGVSRFVVSTRKSPLERRLANAQYQRNMDGDGTLDHNDLQSTGTTNPRDQTINHSSASVSNYGIPRGSNSSYAPFVPLPADMFAKKPENSKMEKVESDKSFTSSHGEPTGSVSGNNEYGKSRESWQSSDMSMNQTPSDDKEREQAEKSERWFKRVAELHNVTDLTSAIPDEDFPEIMPMRKGENRFVVSKKKDRSLTSPTYKRRIALEQANSTNFVPFVPFPPNYFATKDNQQPGKADTPNEGLGEASSSANPEKPSEKLAATKPWMPNAAQVQNMENQQASSGSCYPNPGENWSEIKKGTAYGEPARLNSSQNVTNPQPTSRGSWNSENYRNENVHGTPNQTMNSAQNFSNSQTNSRESESNGDSWKENTKENTNLMGTTRQPSENQNVTDGWTGKSLEGTAVKEPDPLDMSEEAKAERWFRRVAQIKDISELSQIPDEDFPSIMPMRKGVNKFVVSKRKTPLERRLTSTQYRRNLPTVSSDPVKENDNK